MSPIQSQSIPMFGFAAAGEPQTAGPGGQLPAMPGPDAPSTPFAVGDGVEAAGYAARPAAAPAPPSDSQPAQGGFFGVIGTLWDQLEAMLGQLVGDPASPGEGGGLETPATVQTPI